MEISLFQEDQKFHLMVSDLLKYKYKQVNKPNVWVL